MAKGTRKSHVIEAGEVSPDQADDIVGDEALREREGVVIEADASLLKGEYLSELAFNEELIQIRLEPSSDENAPTSHPVWCNGKGAEMMIGNHLVQVAYLPIGVPLVTKRKYVEIMMRAKLDRINTAHDSITGASDQPLHMNNRVKRTTSPVVALTILSDSNPKGHAWATEMMRRYM